MNDKLSFGWNLLQFVLRKSNNNAFTVMKLFQPSERTELWFDFRNIMKTCVTKFKLLNLCVSRIIQSVIFIALELFHQSTNPQNCWNLRKSNFNPFFYHFEPNWVSKSHFEDGLLTRSLPMTSLHVKLGGFRPLPFQMQISKKWKTFFGRFFVAFLQSTLNFENFEKNEPHSLSISKIVNTLKDVVT